MAVSSRQPWEGEAPFFHGVAARVRVWRIGVAPFSGGRPDCYDLSRTRILCPAASASQGLGRVRWVRGSIPMSSPMVLHVFLRDLRKSARERVEAAAERGPGSRGGRSRRGLPPAYTGAPNPCMPSFWSITTFGK